MAFGAYIQSIGVDSGAGTTRNLAYASANAAQALLFLVARFSVDPGVLTITDTRLNLWGIQQRTTGGSNVGIVYRVLSGSAGANTVTLANTVSAICRWALLEYTGPGTADDADSGTDVSGTAETPALVTTVATELLFVGLTTGGDVTFTPGGSLTQRIAVGARLIAADRLVTSTGSYTPSYGLSPDELWIMNAGSYSQAGGGGKVSKNTRAYPLGTERGYARRQGQLRR